MPFRNIGQVATAVDEGRQHIQHILKTTIPGSFSNNIAFADASIGAGLPNYNAYVGNALEATQLIGEKNKSIYVGPALTTEQRYILSVSITQANATGFVGSIYFLDYLLSYALIDCDNTDEQILTNTVGLPRYTDGTGVRAMLVMQTPGSGASTNATIKYVNQANVSKTVSAGILTSSVIGVLASATNNTATGLAPFFPLANGDSGIRSIESIQFDAGVGGFATLVLVKPLFTLSSNEVSSTIEKNFIRQQANLPRIYEGAFLNFIYNAAVTAGMNPIAGQVQFIWTN